MKPGADPAARLGLFDSVCIIVGVIIGAGIYRTSPDVAGQSGSTAVLLGMWLLGGLIVLNGALCYAELVTNYPKRGGDYAFLSAAYGRWLGFLFAWCEFWIIRPANVGAMAFVHGQYAQQLWPLGTRGSTIHALAAVALLSAVNLIGLRLGKWTQNVLTVVKVTGLLMVFAAALLYAGPSPQPTPASSPTLSGLSLALILVLFAYGGWNDVSFVAAEVRDPQRNLPRCLLIGSGLVVLVYLLVNVAFLRVLGLQGTSQSKAVATELLRRCVGEWGGRAISVLICVSCLGAISGMIFTGSRIYHALGRQHRLLGWLGQWNARRGVPGWSMAAQGVSMLALIALLGRDEDGFERLAVFAAPFFWLFFLLVSLSLFAFRRRFAGRERSFSVPFYPVTPALFAASCLFMLLASGHYLLTNAKLASEGLHVQVTWSAAVLGSGAVLWLVSGRAEP